MLRNVFCQQMVGLDTISVVDEEMCEGEKPEAQKLCSEDQDQEPQDSEPKVKKFAKQHIHFYLVKPFIQMKRFQKRCVVDLDDEEKKL